MGDLLAKLKERARSVRAWELELSIQVWRWHLNVCVLPFVWGRWLFAGPGECWSKGSVFHLFAGPLHIWCADYGTVRLLQIGIEANRNSFWWDKPVKARPAGRQASRG